MAAFAETLWDLLGLSPRRSSSSRRRPRSTSAPRPAGGRVTRAQQRYDDLVDELKQDWNIRIHKWRSSTSGCAWEVRDRSGNRTRLIESPYPRGPMSCVVFLHEVGHHAIGFGRYKPRCLEEYKAWEWALDQMQARGLNITNAVRKRHEDALRYAVAKACRRGLKRLPVELEPYLPEGMSVTR
ncbi:MAG: hypothetical protein P8K80_09770 [Phycisphaerales bacterium]|nr:hypothetical protein [Phycisphaerales bacterium]